jgi:hypothetical protein
MEDLMDEELRDALKMSKEELLARRDAGSPAKVSRARRADVEADEPKPRKLRFDAVFYVQERSAQSVAGR